MWVFSVDTCDLSIWLHPDRRRYHWMLHKYLVFSERIPQWDRCLDNSLAAILSIPTTMSDRNLRKHCSDRVIKKSYASGLVLSIAIKIKLASY
jgi:hypothetical protein